MKRSKYCKNVKPKITTNITPLQQIGCCKCQKIVISICLKICIDNQFFDIPAIKNVH